jgi:hypothetical protein
MNRSISSFCQSFGTMLLILGVTLSAISAYADDPGNPGGGGSAALCDNGCSGKPYPECIGGCDALPIACQLYVCGRHPLWSKCECKFVP